nr:clp protease proteolytic subunit [Hermannia pinnata]UNV38490.1 clp protease proteolytic subunit [Hermannia pinnata]
MPVGVPRVPFEFSEDNDININNINNDEGNWVDLHHRVARMRLLFIFKEIDDELTAQITGLMVFLSMEDPTKDQFLFLHTRGGLAAYGVTICGTMKGLAADVQTTAMGSVASTGCFILAAGTSTKRVAMPNARIMMHQPASSFFDSSTSHQLTESMGNITNLRDYMVDVYVQKTGKPSSVVSEYMERDAFMSATEAQAFGLVDLIAEGKR